MLVVQFFDEIVAYLNSDFICYPATHPETARCAPE